MFIGEYICKFDAKGRVIFPAQFKRRLTEKQAASPFVVKKNSYKSCLELYTSDGWELYTKNMGIENSDIFSDEDELYDEFIREFYRGTVEVSLDNSNRLLIPKRLQDFIGSDKELVFAGQKNKIEIWSKEKYENSELGSERFDELRKKIAQKRQNFKNYN